MPEPHISTIIREYTTAAAIIVGGGWALWRWGFEEWLRRHRDFPALDGDVTSSSIDLNDGRVVVTLSALWRNRGKLPVEIETQATFVSVASLSVGLRTGVLTPESDGIFTLHKVQPLADCSAYILEPLTDSLIQTCFVLPKGEPVLFNWGICISGKQKAYPYLSTPMWCTRMYVFDPKALQKED